MRTRLLPLLIVLMAGVLLALGFPLAVSVAAAQQQRVVIDRIDDTTRFAALAQFITERGDGYDERRRTLRSELGTYASVYGIRAGVFYRDDTAMAKAPAVWQLPIEGRGAGRSRRPCWDGAATIRRRSGRGRTAGSSSPRPSCGTVMSSPWWSSTRPPRRCARARCAAGC